MKKPKKSYKSKKPKKSTTKKKKPAKKKNPAKKKGNRTSVKKKAYRALGGKSERRGTALDAGLNLAESALGGRTSSPSLKSGVARAVAATRARNQSRSARMARMLSKVRRQAEARRKLLYRGVQHTRYGARTFGTGVGGKKKKKKDKKKKKKKGKKKGKKSKALQNLRDVFTI